MSCGHHDLFQMSLGLTQHTWACNKWQRDIHPSDLIRENNLQTLEKRRLNSRLNMMHELPRQQASSTRNDACSPEMW